MKNTRQNMEISKLTSQISSISENAKTKQTQKIENSDKNFGEVFKKAIGELNDTQIAADKAVADLATGQITDLHQAAIAIGKAETSMKLMLEIRNKAISSYKEIARTQL